MKIEVIIIHQFEINIIFAHGYQFNSKCARNFAGKIWEELINANDIIDKEITDIIFYDAKHLSLIK